MIQTSGFLPFLNLGSLQIQTYFLVISLVLCACAVWIPRRAEAANLPTRRALDLYIAAMLGGFIGSRLFHIFYEEPAYYFEAPLRVFEVWRGGFVWYGGFLGALMGMWWFLRNEPLRMRWLDMLAPVAALGYAGGRFACFLTGCCFGVECLWHPAHGGEPILYRFPTQAFATIWEAAVGIFLLWYSRRKPIAGTIFWLWVLLHGVGRIAMESMRDDPRGPMAGPLSISLLLSLGFAGLAAWRLSRLRR